MVEQPSRVAECLGHLAGRLTGIHAGLADAPALLLLGRGSSRSASSYGSIAFQHLAGRPALVASPADVAWGRSLPLDTVTAIAVSQSGESTEMIAAAERVRDQGGRLFVVTNTPSSTLGGLVTEDRLINCHAGQERAIPATKTFSTAMACLYAMAIAHDAATVRHAAAALPVAIENVLRARTVPTLPTDIDAVVVVGEGYAAPTAEEAAIKFREILSMPATALEASEFLHGSITSAGPRVAVIAIAADDVGSHLAAQVLRGAASRGAPTISIGPSTTEAAQAHVVPELRAEWMPFVIVPAIQRIAVEAALIRGWDADTPPDLSKITKTAVPTTDVEE
ncbi:SIS domain-containing protein [Euzebya sp.]|uniref:SIS domain-containing protein n=1 Tax=Euzebya sp. TaxID=1971409 RepID=UPI00351933F8